MDNDRKYLLVEKLRDETISDEEATELRVVLSAELKQAKQNDNYILFLAIHGVLGLISIVTSMRQHVH